MRQGKLIPMEIDLPKEARSRKMPKKSVNEALKPLVILGPIALFSCIVFPVLGIPALIIIGIIAFVLVVSRE